MNLQGIRRKIVYVSLYELFAIAISSTGLALGSGSSLERARTSAVNMLVVGELVYLFNVRHFTAHAWRLETLTGNGNHPVMAQRWRRWCTSRCRWRGATSTGTWRDPAWLHRHTCRASARRWSRWWADWCA